MALFGFELDDIARLVALVEAQGLEEFLYEEEGRSLQIVGPRTETPPAPMMPMALPAPMVSRLPSSPINATLAARPPRARRRESGASAPAGGTPIADQIVLKAPLTGVFYRAEKPDAPPLINVGDNVSVGQVLGILEAMKTFSEFKAEHAGVVAAIPVADKQMVHEGTPLIILKKH